jgi:hypothetical protein
MANKPVKKVSAHGVTVSVWENEGKNDSKYHTVSIQRSYKDGDEWKNTETLRMNDVPAAVAALQKAYEQMVVKEIE